MFVPGAGQAAMALRVALAIKKARFASTVGRAAFNSRFVGGSSRLFGNAGAGPRFRAGLLNGQGKAGARLGWSRRPVLSASSGLGRWTFRFRHADGRHRHFLHGPIQNL